MPDTSPKNNLSSRVIGTRDVPWRSLQFLQSDTFKELNTTRKQKLKNSILENNFSQPFYVWEDAGTLYCLDGKHRTDILHELVNGSVPVPELLPATFIACADRKEAAKLVLVYSSMYANVTQDGLADFMDVYNLSLEDIKLDIDLPNFDHYKFEEFVTNPEPEDNSQAAFVSLQERFIVPPFSVLDTRQGYWQERKKKWHDIGINSQATREDVQLIARSGQSTAIYDLRNKMRQELKRDPSWDEILAEAKHRGMHVYEGASVFDPVLCELMYRWFCQPGFVLGDPFAGGSVRGIVASLLGYHYHGVDLRPDQVMANYTQLQQITGVRALKEGVTRGDTVWYTGDSLQAGTLLPNNLELDFLFSCPPYHDLEKYSDNPRDLSNMSYPAFREAYIEIIQQWAVRLKENRFACFVVSEIRGKDGTYRNFVADTIQAFINAGCSYYNEFVLINVAGSLPIRVAKQFVNSRKAGRTHQNVLVFYKGDTTKIKQEFPELSVEEIFGEALDLYEYQPNIASSVID